MAYSTKLYADSRCIAEFFSANELREMVGRDLIEHKEEKKICNCPNCGAPITSYICEYCGTEFEKPKKKLSDEEMRESFAEFARKQRQAELHASQEWQTQNLLNTINSYNVNTQIMNMQNSINSAMALQTCSLRDQMYNASIQTNIYPANHDIEQKEKPLYIESVNKEANALVHGINVLCISLVLFLILVLIVIAYNFLE
jgi:DNA-directed RNA polymerase subunit RPC12/RpoP